MESHFRLSRRRFLASSGAAVLAGVHVARGTAAELGRPRVAAVFTEFRFRSHAYDILINVMGPCLFRGQRRDLGLDVVSFYADQFPEKDMARDASRRFRVPLFASIEEALCLGGRELAVDAVLLIGEHGNYPANELGQRMYPRKQFFDAIVAVMKRSGRFVPVFNDKHLSYRWDWAKAMYDEAQRLGIPLMAGSSVPLAERRPALEVPPGTAVEEAVAVHGGGLESYDFHGLEVLQSMIEARRGGETGIASVQLLTGEGYQRELEERPGLRELVSSAMTAERDAQMKRRTSSASGALPSLTAPGNHALLLNYRDGTKAAVLKVGSSADRWSFACRLRDRAEPLACTYFNGPWGNRNLFSALSHAIAHCFKTRRAPYPVERTLLNSGVLDAAMHSHHEGGVVRETPHLDLAYQPLDYQPFRETGESWKVLTPDDPEPMGFEPGKG